MKKLLSFALASVMTLSAAVGVQAKGRVSSITEEMYTEGQIHIVYNDTVVEYEDVKPVNTDGRVMIPFRAVLEEIGATVEYDDSQRLVTASKGDTTIKFTLMDDTIYINENGVDSTIKMDVPMIIVEDRTLVPIRFMSNALGMNVGWDGDTETVFIMDCDDYFDGAEELVPNFSKLLELKKPEMNKEATSFGMYLSIASGEEGLELTLNGNGDSTYTGEAVQSDWTLGVAVNGVEIKDMTIDVVLDGGDLFVKTNAAEKLADVLEDESFTEMLSLVKSDVWYKIDVMALAKTLDLSEELVSGIEMLMNADGETDISQVMKSAFETDGDVTYDDVFGAAMVLDVFEAIDKYIVVDEKENGAYTVQINITASDFIGMISEIVGYEFDEEEVAELTSMFSFNVSAVAESDGESVEANVKYVLSYIDGADKLDFTLELSDKSENDEKATVEAITEYEDVTQLIVGLMN